MAQLMSRRYPNQIAAQSGVVELRTYKYLQGDMSTQGDGQRPFMPLAGAPHDRPLYREWRMFMEHCSDGNIARLIRIYKAWGYHLPEAFIWWTFLWLMHACLAMDQNDLNGFCQARDDSIFQPEHLPQAFMLSNDIKDENCFFGFARPDRCPGRNAGTTYPPFDQYPAARMGDFGLSRVVQYDADNRPRHLPPGTRTWTAPVSCAPFFCS